MLSMRGKQRRRERFAVTCNVYKDPLSLEQWFPRLTEVIVRCFKTP